MSKTPTQTFIDFLKSETIEDIAGAMIELQKTVDRLETAKQQEPGKVGRITANVKDMVLRQEVMLYTDDYLPIGTAIYTSPPAQQINPETRTKDGLKYSPNYVAGYNDGLKAAQPSKPWVGLTDEEIDRMTQGNNYPGTVQGARRFARATEAKLREKNEHREKNT